MVLKSVSDHSLDGKVAHYTWHQEPERRPAGGMLGVLERCSWQQAA